MSGTKEGGLKARKTNLKKYGKDFYQNIGRMGGKNGHTGGFATVGENGEHTLAKAAGKKGGIISRRGRAEATRTRVQFIRVALSEKKTVEQIAKELNRAPSTIQHYIYEYGLGGTK